MADNATTTGFEMKYIPTMPYHTTRHTQHTRFYPHEPSMELAADSILLGEKAKRKVSGRSKERRRA